MHDHDKQDITMNMDRDPELVRLVVNLAQDLAKAPPKEWSTYMLKDHPEERDLPEFLKYNYVRPNAEHIKEAADLVLLALSLIADRDKRTA